MSTVDNSGAATNHSPDPNDRAGEDQLKRGVLGTGSLVFMVVAAAAPLTVMAGVAPLAIMVGGIGAPVGYLAARLLLWVNTPGVVGILVLQTLTAAATVVYFLRRNKAASTPVALCAGILSAVLLAAATGILVDNIGLLTGASGAINVALVGIVPATLLVGAVVALRLRQRRPLTYAMIGQGGAGEPAVTVAAGTTPEGSK